MQNSQDNDNAGHADDIFGSVAYEAQKPQKKDFLRGCKKFCVNGH